MSKINACSVNAGSGNLGKQADTLASIAARTKTRTGTDKRRSRLNLLYGAHAQVDALRYNFFCAYRDIVRRVLIVKGKSGKSLPFCIRDTGNNVKRK